MRRPAINKKVDLNTYNVDKYRVVLINQTQSKKQIGEIYNNHNLLNKILEEQEYLHYQMVVFVLK